MSVSFVTGWAVPTLSRSRRTPPTAFDTSLQHMLSYAAELAPRPTSLLRGLGPLRWLGQACGPS